MNQDDAMTLCHMYAHNVSLLSYFSKSLAAILAALTLQLKKILLLMPIGSFERTCFMTVLDVHHIRSDNLSFRALALNFSRTEE